MWDDLVRAFREYVLSEKVAREVYNMAARHIQKIIWERSRALYYELQESGKLDEAINAVKEWIRNTFFGGRTPAA